MAAPQIPGEDPTAATAPVACSLTRAGLAEQAGRWERLTARAMTGREQTRDGVRIGFRPGPGTEEELRALVDVESRCCPWATWTVHADGTRLVLEVRSADDGVAALHAIFTGLRAAPAPQQAGRPR
jgi:hypothetical protein